MRLKDKLAIVTGGASGFGAGIARTFIQEGATTIIADRNIDLANKLAEELGAGAIVAQTDVADPKSIADLAHMTAQHGPLDILVNNAGVTHQPKPLDRVSEDEFDFVASVNMRAIFLAARQFVPDMKERRSGVILNIASTGAVSPRPNLTWYNASKGWANTATRGMAVELASFGIRVNAINPVAGETPLLKSFMGEDTKEVRDKFLSTIPIGRFSTPEDIASAALYLCSDEASMVTGICMDVDGGRCI